MIVDKYCQMHKDNLSELQIEASTPLAFCDKIKLLVTTNGIHPTVDSSTIRRLMFYGRSWRLTKIGKDILFKNFKSYVSQNGFNKCITGKIILNMDECCNYPWYMYESKVIMFNETLHFELQMVNGDLNGFVNFKSGN